MTKTPLVFAFVFLFATTSLGDANCNPVDFYAEPNSVLMKMPVPDQDGTSTCFAQTAAGIINFELLKRNRNEKNLLNPLYAAYLYSNSYSQKDIESGKAGKVLRQFNQIQRCDGAEVDRLITNLKAESKITDAELLAILEKLPYRKGYTESTASEVQKTLESDETKINLCAVQSVVGRLRDLHLTRFSSVQLFNELFKNCKLAEKPYSFVSINKSLWDVDQAHLQETMDSALTNGHAVSASICKDFLSNPKLKGLKIKSGSAKKYTEQCGQIHAVMIVGRKNIGGQCRYLIRNSWGPLWHEEGVKCACKLNDGTYQAECATQTPEEWLGCWYDQETLSHNVEEITTFKEFR